MPRRDARPITDTSSTRSVYLSINLSRESTLRSRKTPCLSNGRHFQAPPITAPRPYPHPSGDLAIISPSTRGGKTLPRPASPAASARKQSPAKKASPPTLPPHRRPPLFLPQLPPPLHVAVFHACARHHLRLRDADRARRLRPATRCRVDGLCFARLPARPAVKISAGRNERRARPTLPSTTFSTRAVWLSFFPRLMSHLQSKFSYSSSYPRSFLQLSRCIVYTLRTTVVTK